MFKFKIRGLCTLLLLTASLARPQAITVRSGNGSVGGRDSAVTFLQGPANTDFSNSFTQSDFSNAQQGPAAFIITPNPEWLPSLTADPSAQWIGTGSFSSSAQGNTALYAVTFTIPSAFSSATLALSYAADDRLGTIQQGLYLNGQAVCGNLISTSNVSDLEHSVICTGINSVLQVGTNWLYLDNVNATGPAGLIFSATITTTPTPSPQSIVATVRSGNGSVGGRDSAVTFLQGPVNTDFTHTFTSTDFSNAQNGPAAFILNGLGVIWLPSLSEDPLAHWIGTNANAYLSNGNGTTALYAVSFEVPNQLSSAALTLHYAVDDNLGGINAGGVNSGVYMNGTPVCVNVVPVGTFALEQTITCNDVGPALAAGKNWLYFDAVNLQGAAGLLFSATITTASNTSGPSISAGGVVSAASYSAGLPVAPGSITAVFGNFPVTSLVTGSGTPLPTSISGVALQFGGTAVPLFFVSPQQANIQVPWELAGLALASLSATANTGASTPQAVKIAPFAPGIFSTNGEGAGQGAILDSQYQLVNPSNPVSVGNVIQIYCTGLGAVTNQPASGFPAPFGPLAQTATTPVVTIGGTSAQVLYSGLTPGAVGLYQINAQVPTGITTGPAVAVIVSIGGITSNTVTVAIQPFPSPPPAITSLSPPSATVGTSSLALAINGNGFIASSTVTFNDVPHPPTLLGSNQLTITLSASDLAAIGTYPVVVSNPSPGGGSSAALTFTVTPATPNNPLPMITSLSPTSSPAGVSNPVVLTIIGSGFVASSAVAFNGNAHAPSFFSSEGLSILLSKSDLAVGGNYPVVVTNPTPGGGSSNTAYFSITPSAEVINLAGAWQGTWSAALGAKGTLTANLSQTGASIGGTISPASWCFSSGVISGTISGSQVSLNITFSGGQKVSFSGATNAPATAITGQYTVVSGSCGDGSTGGLTLGR
jgi:uncharacterized protein (TIGR03437 family)